MGAFNGAVLLLFATWWVAMLLLCITESPSYTELGD